MELLKCELRRGTRVEVLKCELRRYKGGAVEM